MKLRWWNKIFALAGFMVLAGCTHSKPAREYMLDMFDQPSLKAQKYVESLPHHRGMLIPPEGTLPRNFEAYPFREDAEGAGRQLQNPLPKTEEIFLAGEKGYNIYCIVCHGPKGLGDGSVVPPFPKPPSLISEKVRTWSDGRIFHAITMGQNLMPSYASQIPAEKRWAIIRYLRVLQRSQHPEPEDIEAYEKYRNQTLP